MRDKIIEFIQWVEIEAQDNEAVARELLQALPKPTKETTTAYMAGQLDGKAYAYTIVLMRLKKLVSELEG